MSRKTSAAQFELMVTFMEQHGNLSKPTSEPNGRLTILRRWEELAELLNSDGSGDTKTTEKWKKVWSDYKNNAKKKAARIHRAAKGTGGGPANFSRLTDLEDRVLNLNGQQVATGLAVEEAGLSQQRTIANRNEHGVASQVEEAGLSQRTIANSSEQRIASPPHLNLDTGDIIECSQLWNQAGPSYRPHIAPTLPASATPPVPEIFGEVEVETARSSHHSDNNTSRVVVASPPQVIEVQDTDMLSPHRNVLPERERDPSTLTQPAASGQTRPMSQQISQSRSGQLTPRRSRPTRTRGSPRRRANVRPTQTEQAAQHFLRSDEEWRQFKMEQHRDFMELKREQNRIKNEEVQVQRGWQTLASRVLDNIEKMVNKYCDE